MLGKTHLDNGHSRPLCGVGLGVKTELTSRKEHVTCDRCQKVLTDPDPSVLVQIAIRYTNSERFPDAQALLKLSRQCAPLLHAKLSHYRAIASSIEALVTALEG